LDKEEKIMKTRTTLYLCLLLGILWVPGIAYSGPSLLDEGEFLFVTNEGGGGSFISVIAPDGRVAPFATTLEFTGPSGLAFDAGSDRLLVSDDSGRVFAVDPRGRTTVIAEGLANPNALGIDQRGRLFVAEAGDGISEVVSGRGALRLVDEVFHGPQSIAFDSRQSLYTSDFSGFVFEITDTREVFIVAEEFLQRTDGGMVIDREDNIYVSDIDGGTIYQITLDGDVLPYIEGLNRPRGLAFNDKGELFITEYDAGNVLRVSGGAVEVFAQGLYGPFGLAFIPRDALGWNIALQRYMKDFHQEGEADKIPLRWKYRRRQ